MTNNLFDKIPDNFFSILNCKNQRIYIDSLMVLRNIFKSDLEIRRIDLTNSLIEHLDSEIKDIDFEEDEEDIENFNENTISVKAHFIVRKLYNCGWIEFENQSGTFDELVSIPDYAIYMLDYIYNITNEKIKEYNGYVYTTYAVISGVSIDKGYSFQALNIAYNNTNNLIKELKSLYSNIKRYQKMIIKKNYLILFIILLKLLIQYLDLKIQ